MKRAVLKSIMLLFSICALLSYTKAQSELKPDLRLNKAYDQEYLENLRQNSPSTLEYLNFELDNSWFIAGPEILPKADAMEYLYYRDPVSGEKSDIRVEVSDVEDINIAEYYYDRKYESHVFYKIGDSGMIIGFYSVKETAQKYNISKNQ
ncbi:MAG TPA: hypothetical protein PLL66_09090 [Bacteroidales bacterium]|nr:hypothetical protein [Bacteroidales bacterium]